MPTDRDDEARISAMLNQAEPPKSPRHLDTAILDYAAENAAASGHRQESRGAFMSLGWLQQNWMPAAATLSVAAIAVSVSLQTFTGPDIAGAARAELALGDAVALKQADSTAAEFELEERLSAAAQTELQDAPARAGQGVRSADGLLALQAADRLAADSNRTAIAADGVALAANRQLASPSAAVSDDLVEEVLVTGSSVRRAASTASVITRELQPSLAENLIDDAALQDVVISVLRRSLGVSDQLPLVNSQEFSFRVNPLVESYRQLSDPTALANIQNSYSLARAERQDVRLPDLIEELVVVLEALGQ